MFALNLANDGRVLSATYAKYAAADAVKVDNLPDGNIADYRYIDGEFVYDPIERETPAPSDDSPVTWAALASAYNEGVNSI